MPHYLRSAKNKIFQYSMPQVKVREATSNDPWGPNTSLLAEIANLSHDQVALQEMLEIILKRLGDLGKNWRHVYKSLIVLEHLCLIGNQRIYQYCLRNKHIISTLRTFQYSDPEGRDYGVSVREKAKTFSLILEDPEVYKSEQETLVKSSRNVHKIIDENLAFPPISKSSCSIQQLSIMEPSSARSASYTQSANLYISEDIKNAIPKSLEEEEEQVKLATALSQEEHLKNIKTYNTASSKRTESFSLYQPQQNSPTNQQQQVQAQVKPAVAVQKKSLLEMDLFNFGITDSFEVETPPAGKQSQDNNAKDMFNLYAQQSSIPQTMSTMRQFNSEPNIVDIALQKDPQNTHNNFQNIKSTANIQISTDSSRSQNKVQSPIFKNFLGEHSDLVNFDILDNKQSYPFSSVDDPNKTLLRDMPDPFNSLYGADQSNFNQTTSYNPSSGPNASLFPTHDGYGNLFDTVQTPKLIQHSATNQQSSNNPFQTQPSNPYYGFQNQPQPDSDVNPYGSQQSQKNKKTNESLNFKF